MKLQQLAELCGGQLHGTETVLNCDITSVGTLEEGVHGQISFLSNPKYRRYLQTTPVSAVILSAADLEYCPDTIACIVADNPYLAYALVARAFVQDHRPPVGIDSTAVVSASAQVDPNAAIGPLVVIGEHCKVAAGAVIHASSVLGANVQLGANSVVESQVTLWHDVDIGQRCLIHSGAVIGSDGFGNARDGSQWVKIPQLGRVVIGDDVEIGANTTVDRGAVEDTVIAHGVRLDNLIQIGHNVRIGEDTAIAALCGIAGSAEIGARVMMGGLGGVAGHIQVGDDSFIGGMGMVTHSLPEQSAVGSGVPARPIKDWHRTLARLHKLTDLEKRVKQLERQLQQTDQD